MELCDKICHQHVQVYDKSYREEEFHLVIENAIQSVLVMRCIFKTSRLETGMENMTIQYSNCALHDLWLACGMKGGV